MSVQDAYVSALRYAALKHEGQQVPGTELPYLVHIAHVAMEVMIAASHTDQFDTEFAITLALLHDILEDTKITYEEISKMFGEKVADGVLALTKLKSLGKENQIKDSVERIKMLDKEVGAVKLADRITNLDAPAADWEEKKRQKYKEDSQLILSELSGTNAYLAERLQQKIDGYTSYVETGFKS